MRTAEVIEKRQHPRAEIAWPVILKNNREIISGETKNISAGGAYIRCRKPLKPTEVLMHISVSLLSPRIRALAEVVRSDIHEPAKNNASYGIGIRFIAISDKDQKHISSRVAEHLDCTSGVC